MSPITYTRYGYIALLSDASMEFEAGSDRDWMSPPVFAVEFNANSGD
jgi:hypothetical protein